MKLGDLPGIEFTEVPPEDGPDGWQFFFDGGNPPTVDAYGLVVPSDIEHYNSGPLELTETSAVWHIGLPLLKEFYMSVGGGWIDIDDGTGVVFNGVPFVWSPSADRWIRYSETGGTTTWEVAGDDLDWRVVGTYPTPSAEGAVDLNFYNEDSTAHFYSFNVPDDPAPPPNVALVHPFVAAVYDREGNARAGALVEIQGFDPPHDPAHVWLDHEHTDYVFEPGSMLTSADGLFVCWLPDGLYRWRSTFEEVSGEWEPVELQDPLSGPQGPAGSQGPAGTQGESGSNDVVWLVPQITRDGGEPLFILSGATLPMAAPFADDTQSIVVMPPMTYRIDNSFDASHVLTLGVVRRTADDIMLTTALLRATTLDGSVSVTALWLGSLAIPLSVATVPLSNDWTPDPRGLPLGGGNFDLDSSPILLIEARLILSRP